MTARMMMGMRLLVLLLCMATAPLAIAPMAATAPARANTSGAWVSNDSHQTNSFQGA